MERKEFNLKLKNSESSLSTIFNSSVDGFMLLNATNHIRAFNRKAEQFILISNGNRPFEIGEQLLDYLPAQRQQDFELILNEVKNGRIIEYDVCYEQPHGIKWIHYTLTPVVQGDEFDGTCISGRDFTANKNYLNQIEQQNEAMREISWIQSHSVRAPLARIMGIAAVAKDERSKAEVIKLMSYLEISCDELDRTIKKITGLTAEQKNKNTDIKNDSPDVLTEES